MNILLNPGDKALITCDNFFIAPDGKTYRGVFGTIGTVRTSEESLGVKTNARSTNWYLEIGNMLLAGCQIHYAIKTDKVNLGAGESWAQHEGRTVVDTTPSQIYNADQP